MSGIVVEPTRDLESWVDLRNSVIDWWPLDAASLRHAHERGQPRLELDARLEGELVGGAMVTVPEMESDDTIAYANVWVLPPRRARGIGTALSGALCAQARAWGKTGLQVLVREADDGGFAGRRGFAEVSRSVRLELDVARAEPASGDEIEVVTLAQRPDLLHAVYEVDLEAVPDVPTPQPWRVGTFDEWRARDFEGPGVRPEGWFLALVDGEVAGYAMLMFPPAWPDAAFHEMTGVRRAYRGRGIAGALKRAQIRWAKEARLARLVTENHEHNEPIRRLNERLGYRPQAAIHTLRGPVA
jgi:GNAT superfamily N-acetyltransferase